MLLSSLSILMGAILVPSEYLWWYSTYITLVCLYLITLKRLIPLFFAFISLLFVVSSEFTASYPPVFFEINSLVYFDKQEKTLLIKSLEGGSLKSHNYKGVNARVVAYTDEGLKQVFDDVSLQFGSPDHHFIQGRLTGVMLPQKEGSWWEKKLYIDRQNVQVSIRFDLIKNGSYWQKESSLRERILTHLDRHLSTFTTWRFSKALILGEDNGWSERDTWLVRTLGLAHLFVVSGLHVGFVFFIGSGISFIFWRLAPNSILLSGVTRWHINVIIIIPLLFFYAYMTHWGEPVVRASIMLSVYLLAKALTIKASPYSIITFALWLILVVEPRMILSPGLWLSFSMVYLLIGFFMSSAKRFRLLIGQIMLSTSSMVLILGWQEAISSVSIFVNLCLIPFSAFIWFPIGLLASLETLFFSTVYIYEKLDLVLYLPITLIDKAAFFTPLLFFERFESGLPRLIMLVFIIYWVFQSPLIRGYAIALGIWFILFSSYFGVFEKADFILQNTHGALWLSDGSNSLLSSEWGDVNEQLILGKHLNFDTNNHLVFSLSGSQEIIGQRLIERDLDWVFFKKQPSEKVVTTLEALNVNWISISDNGRLKFFRDKQRVTLQHSSCLFSFFLFKSDTCKRVELLESMINYRQI